MTRALPTVFGAPGRELAGFYHPPAAGAERGPAVVLCNPLGYEAMGAHRTMRHLAERLAAAGFPALRFDYHGTGDSSGASGEPGRIGAWVEDIRAAVREVRARSGAQRVALFGLRFGASLATVAASGEKDVDALVAWAPVVSGRAHVRELRAFRMLKAPGARRGDDGEEIGGYLFAQGTLADMSAIELLARSDRGVGRVLVVPRGDAAARDESELVLHWKAAGAEAELATTSGYSAMMRDDPYDSVVPSATLDAIVAWLARGSTRAGASPAAGAPPEAVLPLPGPPGGPGLRETAILFGPDQRLFGIITETDAPSRPDRPAVLLLNVGADSHVGPHRMNVELARELAAMGHVTFRFDVGGLGESLPAAGERENRLYDLRSVDDVKTAMTALGQERGQERAARFVLVGLCSGAFLAYHAAVGDERVTGQVLLNMFAFEWKEGDPVAPVERKTYLSNRFYAQQLLDSGVWRRAIKGKVDVRGIATVMAGRFWERAQLDARDLGARILGRRAFTPVEKAFHALCDRGVQSLMLFSDKDGGLDMITPHLGPDARRMTRRREFSIEIASGVDHTFASLASQERLRQVVARYVAARFG